jgi:hypothetical protein
MKQLLLLFGKKSVLRRLRYYLIVVIEPIMRGFVADKVSLIKNKMNWCTTRCGAVGAVKAVPSWVLYVILVPFTVTTFICMVCQYTVLVLMQLNFFSWLPF